MNTREIKFRAWDVGAKKMRENISPNYPWTSVGLILQQFTGIKDKNGKEIYEGDILKYTRFEGYLLPSFTGEMFWKDVQWSIGNGKNCVQTDVDLAEVDELENDLLNHLEVIGNIYENPSLLK